MAASLAPPLARFHHNTIVAGRECETATMSFEREKGAWRCALRGLAEAVLALSGEGYDLEAADRPARRDMGVRDDVISRWKLAYAGKEFLAMANVGMTASATKIILIPFDIPML